MVCRNVVLNLAVWTVLVRIFSGEASISYGDTLTFGTTFTFGGITNAGDQQDAGSSFAVDQFRPTWGTLTNVEVDIQNTVSLYGYFDPIPGGGYSSATGGISLATWGQSAPLIFEYYQTTVDNESVLAADFVAAYYAEDEVTHGPFGYSQTYGYDEGISTNLTPFEGTGLFEFGAQENIYFEFTGYSLFEFLAYFNSSVTTTYTFTAPSSYASGDPITVGSGGGGFVTGSPPTGGWGVITVASNGVLNIGSGNSVLGTGVNNWGTINQSGGNLTISGTFNQTGNTAYDATSNTTTQGGIYNLSGGNATFGNLTGSGAVNMSDGNLSVGSLSHTGAIAQTGGTLSAANFSQTGTITYDGSGNQSIGGVYALSNGSASLGNVTNNGIISQSGGNLTATTYTSTDSTYVDGSNVTQHFGVLQISGGVTSLGNATNGGTITQSGGYLFFNGLVNTGTLNLGDLQTGSLIDLPAFATTGAVVDTTTHPLTIDGGTVIVDNFDCEGSVTISGGGFYDALADTVYGGTTIGAHGSILQTGGDVSLQLNIYGGYEITGGTFWDDSNGVNVMYGGSFTVAGGEPSFSGTDIAGSFVVTAGSLSAGSSGTESTGTYTQSGGNVTLSGYFTNEGSMHISGGRLDDQGNGVFVDSGSTYTQSGGNVTISLIVSGNASISNGTLGDGGFGTTVNAGGNFTQTGGAVTFSTTTNNGSVSLTGGNATLGHLTGTGSLTIGHGAAVTVDTVFLKSGSTYGSINNNGTLTASTSNATRQSQDIALVIGNLTLGTAGLINLNNHDLIIHSGQTLSSVKAFITAAYDSGAWDGSSGITSSALGTDKALGYATAGELGISTFDGVSVSSGDIIVKYTYGGDANLDGKVDQTDFGILSSNYGASSADWYHGDFNYDGTVGSADLGILAGNYQEGTGGSFGSPLAIVAAGGSSAVPEPASFAVVGLGATGLLARRKRR